MTTIKFYESEDLSELDYVLDETQLHYTSEPRQSLKKIEQRNQNEDFFAYPVTIIHEGEVAGYFVLDFGDEKSEHSENPNAVLLRSLSVNPEFQGKGIGKSAIIEADNFVKQHFADCDEIVLAVNEKNTPAFQLYLDTGYVHNGKMRNGSRGSQFILHKKL